MAQALAVIHAILFHGVIPSILYSSNLGDYILDNARLKENLGCSRKCQITQYRVTNNPFIRNYGLSYQAKEKNSFSR